MSLMTLAPTDRLACAPEVLSRVLDGEAILLHLGSGTYFGMNEVATRAWELIVAGTTWADMCRALVAEFEVSESDIARDMTEFLSALQEKKLVTVSRES
jgi:hypothetical protein